MVEPGVRSIAEIICKADPQLPEPDALVFTDKGAVEAWRTRVDVARAVLKMLRSSKDRHGLGLAIEADVLDGPADAQPAKLEYESH